MFSYYGSKSKIIDLYPAPRYSKIIEPFAGSARYALKYWDRDVLLVDKYEVIIRIWKWLQQCSPQDILKLPNLKKGDSINRSDFDCIEAAWFMGMIICVDDHPRLRVSARALDIQSQKQFAADNLDKIRHWKISQDDYRNIPNQEATWFIDPPYFIGGDHYPISNKSIDYSSLADWSRSRSGQVIVCENTKANWLPFYPIARMSGNQSVTTESVWCNDVTQLALFSDTAKDAPLT